MDSSAARMLSCCSGRTSLFLLVAFFPTCLGVYEHIKNRQSVDSSQSFPFFSKSSSLGGKHSNSSAFSGQSAHLHCVVRDIGDRTVSWIRKSDLHVLTSGLITFSGDQRFSPHHFPPESDIWTLQIKFVQLRDAGEYQCQVNSEPKISTSVFLYVTEARARIESPSNKEVHVRQRSRVKLSCVVDLQQQQQQQHSDEEEEEHLLSKEKAVVFWYLDGAALDWPGQTGNGKGIAVTEQRGRQLVSTLVIERADVNHAGKFTCAPSYAKPDTVTLHVIDGESRAELQGNSGGGGGSSSNSNTSSGSNDGNVRIVTAILLLLPTALLQRLR